MGKRGGGAKKEEDEKAEEERTEESVAADSNDKADEGEVPESTSASDVPAGTTEVPTFLTQAGFPRTEKLLNVITCKRRKSREALYKERILRYRDIIALARKVSKKRAEWYEKLCWWSEATTKKGTPIFVIAPRGPKGQVEVWVYMWEFLAFAVNKMHSHVVAKNQPFCLVWVQQNDHRMWSPALWQFKSHLHERYAKNLEAVHVVHPSWGCRLLRLVLWPFAEDSFWDAFFAHERIEFLDTHINLKQFKLPKDIYEYDKFLDKQAAEMNEQAKSNMMGGSSMFGGMGNMGGGMGSVMTEQDRKEHTEQMEQLKKLLKEKGMDPDNMKMD